MATLTHTVAKVFVVNEHGEVLFLRRSETDTRRPLQWDLPGGGVDVKDGETLERAAIRETQEEAGIRVGAVAPVYALTEAREWGVGTWVFFAAHVAGDAPVILSHEHCEFQWFTLDDALKHIEYPLHLKVVEFLRTHRLLGPTTERAAS